MPFCCRCFRWSLTLAIDSRGLFIADRNNHRLRKVDAAGFISTVLGDGMPGSDTHQLSFPAGVSISATGDVYISDQNNHRIRNLKPDGGVEIVAGTGMAGFNGDGLPGQSTQIFSPESNATPSERERRTFT